MEIIPILQKKKNMEIIPYFCHKICKTTENPHILKWRLIKPCKITKLFQEIIIPGVTHQN